LLIHISNRQQVVYDEVKIISKVAILLGGGIDSAALIDYYLSRDVSIKGYHFDYGQPSLPGELKAVDALSQHYSVPVSYETLGFHIVCSAIGEYRFRNSLFLVALASLVPYTSGLVAIGVHTGTRYYDCSAQFVQSAQKSFDEHTHGRFNIDAPFISFSKKEVIDYCRKRAVPIGLTFSCERLGDFHCGRCSSCLDRKSALE
jgi:7-cyano-7-deazaguanine synthase